MASLTALQRDLSEKMSTERLHEFVTEEVKQNTQSLHESMLALDSHLQRVQHDSGIRARFYNDPVGDWQINELPELLPMSAEAQQQQLKLKGRSSYVTYSQQRNKTFSGRQKQQQQQQQQSPPPPPKGPPPTIGRFANVSQLNRIAGDSEVQQLMDQNNELAQALYLKEREILELRAVEEENMALRMASERGELGEANSAPEHEYVYEMQPDSAAVQLEAKRAAIQQRMQMLSGARQYNALAQKVAQELARKNEEKKYSARSVSTSRPPTWAVSPTKQHMSTPLWVLEEEKLANEQYAMNHGVNNKNNKKKNNNNNNNKSAPSNRMRAKKLAARKEERWSPSGQHRYQRDSMGYAAKDRGSSNVRGRFKNIEMTFGEPENDVEIDSDDEEIMRKYPVSRRGASRTSRRPGMGRMQANEPEESADMRAYRLRLRQKSERQGKLHEERSRAREFWLR
jgi:hypothetical protein